MVGEAWLTHPDRRQRAIAIDLPLQLIEHAFHFDGLRLQALESVGIFGWCKQNGFATMHNSVRNVALELHDHRGMACHLAGMWAQMACASDQGRPAMAASLRTTRRSADVATYFRTFVNAAWKASVQDVMLPADDLAFAQAWLAAVPVRVISSPDRPNTRPPQRYRATGPAA